MVNNVKANVKINLTDGEYLTRSDQHYLTPGRDGNECGDRCPVFPYYQCTRDKGHGTGTKSKESDLDHAAHGWFKAAARRILVMFARWSR